MFGPGEDHDASRGVEREVVGRDRVPARASSTGWRPSTIVERVAAVDDRPNVAALWATSARPARKRRAAPARAPWPEGPGAARRPGGARPRTARTRAAARRSSAPSTFASYSLSSARHVSLGAGQGLAADVLGGHTRGLGVGHLDAVAEHAIEAHAQAGDAGARALALLEAGDPVPRLARVARTIAAAPRSSSRG